MRLWNAALAAALLATPALPQPASAQLMKLDGSNTSIVQMGPGGVQKPIKLQTLPKGAPSIFSFVPPFPGLTNHRSVTFTQLPADKDLPGLDYLKLFGFRYGRPAQ
jgi:hypothetical protein